MPVKHNESLDTVRQFWQQRTTRTLTNEDAREIQSNLAGFFGVLRSWDSASRQAEKTASSTTTTQPQAGNQGANPTQKQ